MTEAAQAWIKDNLISEPQSLVGTELVWDTARNGSDTAFGLSKLKFFKLIRSELGLPSNQMRRIGNETLLCFRDARLLHTDDAYSISTALARAWIKDNLVVQEGFRLSTNAVWDAVCGDTDITAGLSKNQFVRLVRKEMGLAPIFIGYSEGATQSCFPNVLWVKDCVDLTFEEFCNTKLVRKAHALTPVKEVWEYARALQNNPRPWGLGFRVFVRRVTDTLGLKEVHTFYVKGERVQMWLELKMVKNKPA